MKNTKIGFFVETNEEEESNIINDLEKFFQTGFGDGRTVDGLCDDDSDSQDDGTGGKSDGRPVRMVKDSSITKK